MKKKVAVIAGATALSIVMATTGMADSVIKEITAHMNYGLKMKLNGQAFNPTEADGSAIRPITYNGRTYLPVAALGEALGIGVSWDGATQTVIIGENDEKTYLTADMIWSPYYGVVYTEDTDNLAYDGNVFRNGVLMGNPRGTELRINTEKKYSKIAITFLAQNKDVVFNIYKKNDGSLLKTVTAKSGIPNFVEVDLLGAEQIEIKADAPKDSAMILGDVYFK